MRKISNAYKTAMAKDIRDRAYIKVTVGIVNKEAQKKASTDGTYTFYSNSTKVFKMRENYQDYATYEQNYWRADGSQILLSKNSTNYANTDITTNGFLGQLQVKFTNGNYDIKGLTLVFEESAYPTKLKITTSRNESFIFDNTEVMFSTDKAFGEISSLTIEALEMAGGSQRLHIHEILLGVGLLFQNEEVEKADLSETIHPISEELPSKTLNVTVFDINGVFNVEDSNSYINYLEQKQDVRCLIGMTLANGHIEWLNMGNTFLKDWKSSNNRMQFTSTDLFAQMDDEYGDGDKLYTRTAYAEAESILDDLGFDSDEYFIDNALKSVTLTNPMPKSRHGECLQLLANATRCILYQDTNGFIAIKGNFDSILDNDSITVTSSDETAWSNKDNVVGGASVTYADLTNNFYQLDGMMYLLPDDNNYLSDTGFVSNNVSGSNGLFTSNPYVQLQLSEAQRFFSFYCDFAGSPPKKINITTYNNNQRVEFLEYNNLDNENLIYHNFLEFDTCKLTVVRTQPYSRVVLNRFGFSTLSDFVLTKDMMMEKAIGYKDQTVKTVSVKVYTYEEKDDGDYSVVDDDVWVEYTVSKTGKNIKVENQLINSETQAEKVAEWIGKYYKSNTFYDVKFRGDPRLEALDTIKMESDVISDLTVEVLDSKMSYNGAFSGTLELHKIN